MNQKQPDTRIPLKPRTLVETGEGVTYRIESFGFATKYSLVYLAHPIGEEEHKLVLFELYPHPDVRGAGFVQRQDDGAVLISTPFQNLFGPDEAQLRKTYREGQLAEVPKEFALLEPAWITAKNATEYLMLDPWMRKQEPVTYEIPETNPLPLIPGDEMVSYLILHRHPLYRYRDENGDIQILCLGGGVFMQRMILSMVSCGQLPDTRLHIHVVANSPREEFVQGLLEKAPMLGTYTNLLPDREPADNSVIFHYRQVEDVLREDVQAELPRARYILVSLGDSDANGGAAVSLARRIAEDSGARDQETILHYYRPEAMPAVSLPRLPKWLQVVPFSADMAGYGEDLLELGRLTVRLAHMYNKMGDARISLARTAEGLAQDDYGQKSSCASVLHLKYKLAALGIDPQAPAEEIIPAFRKALENRDNYASLLAVEHARWLYYMMADGYTQPTEAQLMACGFETGDNGKFNGSWKDKANKRHHCMVPCRAEGIVLTREDFDRYATREAIEHASFDPLDKVSLLLHLLAREKCEKILAQKRLEAVFRRISDKLAVRIAAAPGGELTPVLKNLQETLEQTETVVCGNAGGFQSADSGRRLAELNRLFTAAELDIGEEMTELKNTLSVFGEFAAFRDYKVPDEVLVRQLPWILYGDRKQTLIMFCNGAVADSITTPLLMDPDNILYFGREYQPRWREFLRAHGCRAQVSFVPCDREDAAGLREALQAEIDRLEGNVVVDITGARDAAAIAASQVCAGSDRLGLIRRTEDNILENLRNYPCAAAYTLPATLTSEDVFALHGASRLPEETHYMEQLDELVPMLWKFYRDHQEDWNMISAFFALPRTRPAELYLTGLTTNSTAPHDNCTYVVAQRDWQRTNLEACLKLLQRKKVIKSLSIKLPKKSKDPVQVTFRFPKFKQGGSARPRLDAFFNDTVRKATVPFRAYVSAENPEDCSITISSGYKVMFQDDKSDEFWDQNKIYLYKDMESILRDMDQLGLIYLQTLEIDPGVSTRIAFTYSNPALRDCLVKAGNILELYIWTEARKTYRFDDVQANFSFTWKEDVSNELDVVATQGMTSLVISAKTGAMNKEHLYELSELASRFSVNSIPVIIYSSDRAYEDGRVSGNVHPVKERARAMGIHLIDLNELEEHNLSLGRTLVRIASGETVPAAEEALPV